MEKRLDSIVTELRNEEEKLSAELQELQARAGELEAAVERVRSALEALGQKPERRPATRKASQKGARKEQVKELVVGVLVEEGPLELDELKQSVEKEAKRQGISRMGLALRLREVLKEDSFIETPAGYRMADAEQEGQRSMAATG